MTRPVTALLVAGLIAVGGTACAVNYDPGPAGKVVDKHRSGKVKRWLTVETPDGTQHKFRVSRGDYGDCYRGSNYPRCTER